MKKKIDKSLIVFITAVLITLAFIFVMTGCVTPGIQKDVIPQEKEIIEPLETPIKIVNQEQVDEYYRKEAIKEQIDPWGIVRGIFTPSVF